MKDDPASLDRLHDIVAAPPAPWWPPAPGWWLLAGLAGLWAVAAGWALIARHRRNAYRRMALAELQRLEAAGDVAGLATLLKRVALSAFSREAVASLSGEAWLAFLDRTGATDAFTHGPGRGVEAAAFTRTATPDAGLFDAARRWIISHRTGASC
jgi:hypothetical protein